MSSLRAARTEPDRCVTGGDTSVEQRMLQPTEVARLSKIRQLTLAILAEPAGEHRHDCAEKVLFQVDSLLRHHGVAPEKMIPHRDHLLVVGHGLYGFSTKDGVIDFLRAYITDDCAVDPTIDPKRFGAVFLGRAPWTTESHIERTSLLEIFENSM